MSVTRSDALDASPYDNLYDYLGCDPIFDELNAFGRANKSRLEREPAPTGDPSPSRLEAAFEALDSVLDEEPLDDVNPRFEDDDIDYKWPGPKQAAPVPTFSVVDDEDEPFPDYR